MRVRHIADTLTVAIALFTFYLGAAFLLAPESSTSGFGLPEWPSGEATAFLNVKAVRDLTPGVIALTLLLIGQRRALGWTLLGTALIPIGDGTVVLAWGGDPVAAFAIHYLTAVAVIAGGLLQLRVARAEPTNELPQSGSAATLPQ